MRVRYFTPDGTAVPSEGEELWRRLNAAPAETPSSDVEPSQQKTERTKEEEAEGIRLDETFTSLTAARSELLLLHGLLNQLESQSTLVVTFVPDKASADDFLFQRNKQKLIKADEKRRQMEEAAEILRGIHASLEAQVKTERTFYRELIGLSRFHSVRIQPTTLSPFQVDLSVRSGWNVELHSEPLLVDLQPDSEGHLSIASTIPQPSLSEVEKVVDTVEQCREQVQKEFSDMEGVSTLLLEEYKKQMEAGDNQRRAPEQMRKRHPNLPDSSNKRPRLPEHNRSITLDAPSSLERSISRVESGKDTFMKKVMSLELDTEDEELLVSSEGGESDSSSEDLAPAITLNEPLKEEWFSRKELIAMTKVHMALCNLQFNRLWELCERSLQFQADKANLRLTDRRHLQQALNQGASLEAQCFRTDLLMRFVQSVYRLAPFLDQIDIRDLNLSNKEKVLLLTKPTAAVQQQGQNEDVEAGEKESQMPSMAEEEEEWLTRIRPLHFFRLRFQDTAPALQSLLPTIMSALNHRHCLRNLIWPCLGSIPQAITHVERSPGALATEIGLEIPGSFQGKLFIDSGGVLLQGYYLGSASPRRMTPIKIPCEQFKDVIQSLME